MCLFSLNHRCEFFQSWFTPHQLMGKVEREGRSAKGRAPASQKPKAHAATPPPPHASKVSHDL